jgi:hypothetical protein
MIAEVVGLPNPQVLDGTQKSKHIQEPHNHDDNHHSIQDRFNRSCHRYERIHEPKQNTNHDQSQEHWK